MTDLTPQIIAFLEFCQTCFYIPQNWYVLGPINALQIAVGAAMAGITIWGVSCLFAKNQGGSS